MGDLSIIANLLPLATWGLCHFLFFGFQFRRCVARLVGGEAGAHCAKLKGVVASALGCLELDLQSILELLLVVERGVRVSAASPKTSRAISSMPLVPGNN